MTWHTWMAAVALACLSVAQAAQVPATTKAKPPGAAEAMHPFNQEDYLLAFEAMSNVEDLERAFRIASEAVRQRPTDMAWRLKLARICDWTERYPEAAEHWKVLFQSGNKAAETIEAMLRLLPQLDAPETALQVWAVVAQRRPLTEEEWRDIYEFYESAAEPDEGSVFFELQYRRLKHPYLLELAAVLAEHAENVARASSLYAERSGLQPFSMDMLLRAVVSLVRQDRMQDALTLMQRHEHQVETSDFVFWQLLSQLAWEQHAYDSAQKGYERLAKLPQATAGDWSRLIYLVRQKHPDQAASLSLEAYRRFGTPDLLMQALGIYGESSNHAAQARALKTLSATELAEAEKITQFLLIRAQIHRYEKQPDLAWQDLRQAMLQAPGSDEVSVTALWFLIDQKRVTDLAALLRQRTQRASDTPLYWLPFAVASQVLDRHTEAVRWYAKEVRRVPDDPLLLLNYADAMERTRQAGMAARVRRHAWLLLKQKYPQPEDFRQLTRQPEMLALARLAMLNTPGDPGLRLVRNLVSQARLVPDERADEQTLALVLGWAILKDQPENARAWMWLRYASQARFAAPLWGQGQVALQLKDTHTMASLLDRSSAGLPIYNRYDTAYELGHVKQAQDIAFKGMSAQEGDEPLYDRYRVHVPLQANYVQMKVVAERQGSLDTLGLQFETRLALSPKLHLILNGAQARQTSTDPTLSLVAPGMDRLQSLEIRWQGAAGQTSVAVSRADEVDTTTGLRISQTLQWGGRASLEARLDHRVESTLSAPLRVAGLESALGVSLNYTLGRREYLRLSPRLSNYFTQQGDYLGSGRSLDFEVGYRIRTDYPDWRVRAFVTYQQYTRNQDLGEATRLRLPARLQTALADSGLSVSDYFIPQGSTTVGTCLSMGENVGGQNLQTIYSRAWRPYFDACLTHNTLNGLSYNGLLGLAGSVTGEDHLSVQLQNSNNAQTSGAATQSLAIRYRHYY
jgi:predicted Zn-dependent protease